MIAKAAANRVTLIPGWPSSRKSCDLIGMDIFTLVYLTLIQVANRLIGIGGTVMGNVITSLLKASC